MNFTHVLPLALPPVVMVALCAVTARAIGGDPMLGAELGLAVVIGVWLTLLLTRIRPAIVGQRQLEQVATPIRLGHRDIRLLSSGRAPEAFVVGPLQPAIFISGALLEVLDADELEAVLLHEDHHRRTRAPLRELALACWLRLVCGLPAMARWVERRVAHLEIEADRYALAAGASSATLASALIKCDRSASLRGMGFSSAADLRLRRLVDGGGVMNGPAAAPIEWLAPVLLALGLAACHLFLG
ncbi:MAG: M56 family metallopeptidase [Candidatus Limnocylindria bacterium]